MKDLTGVFGNLREVLLEAGSTLKVKTDGPTEVSLECEGQFFAAVRLGKNYVSYHLMPLYFDPGLLEQISPELRKRLKGKTCFNFTRLEDGLRQDLLSLTCTALEQAQTAPTQTEPKG